MRGIQKPPLSQIMVVDIETATDQDLTPFQLDRANAEDMKAAGFKIGNLKDPKKLRDAYASHYDKLNVQSAKHKIVCISWTMANDRFRNKLCVNDDGEDEMIGYFIDELGRSINELGTVWLAGWNFPSFDLQKIVETAMRHDLYRGSCLEDYRFYKKYDNHPQVIDLMNLWNPHEDTKLKTVAEWLGCPVEPHTHIVAGHEVETTGAHVGELWRAGRVEDIGSYCAKDVEQEAWIAEKII